MSSGVTIGKQNSSVTKTTRPVTLKDAPPRLRERLKKAEQAEIAPQIGAVTSSSIEQKLEWFRAYRYGKYDAGKDEETAFQCLKEYVSLRESNGENRFGVWQELLHGFAYGSDMLEADRNDVEWLAAEIYKDTDILDSTKAASLMSVFQSEGINNIYTEALRVAKNELKSMQFWFSHDPFYPSNWLCYLNAMVFFALLAMGFFYFFPIGGWKSLGIVSKYSVILAAIAIPLNLIFLYWNYKENRLCEHISSIPPHPSLSALKSEMDKRKSRIEMIKKDDIEIYGTPDYAPATIVVCALLLFFGIPKAEQYERYNIVEQGPQESKKDVERQNVTGSDKEKNESSLTIVQQKKEESPATLTFLDDEPCIAASKVLRAYHENITKRYFQQAYTYFDREMQEYFNYDNWVSGHQTTVKSNPYDIKVASESPEKVVLTYSLQTVDNPGGEKVFEGKAVVVKTENGWKINDIENTLKQETQPKPQQQPAPSAPPTTSPNPAPAAPSAPPAQPEIVYRTFTEKWYGFSFEYPAAEGDFPQADSKGGERAVEYWIDLPNNQGRVLMGTEFAWHDATEADMRYVADDKHSNDFEMLSANSYIVRWNQGNEKITRKTFMVPNHRKGSSGLVRQYIEIRSRGKLSAQNQEVAEHMMNTFQPGD